jgi:hypothetical protein
LPAAWASELSFAIPSGLEFTEQTQGDSMASTPGKFAQDIQNSDALQIIGVAANISGIISSGLAIYSFIDDLGQPTNQDLLNAIQNLQQTLQSDFTQLGNLIAQQIQIVVDTVNRDAMAAALASSDVATASIQDFLSSKDPATLETAKSESIAGVQFFIELNLSSAADLAFFLPGFVKAGTMRLYVIASEPANLREPKSVVVNGVNAMVTLLTSMIDSIINTVTTAHTVTVNSHIIQCPILAQVVEGAASPSVGKTKPVTVIEGYSHNEHGVSLEYFDAQKGNPPCEQPSGHEKGALAAAELGRTQGIAAELAFIGIPGFQQILQSWKNFVTAPITTVVNLNGKWASGGVTGPVIAVHNNAISIDMSFYKRPAAFGFVVDSSDIMVTFPDDSTYTAKLQAPNTIAWSNNSTWTKA